MKIGIVTGEYPPMQGGVGGYTVILARAFVAHGHTVCVLSTTDASSTDKGISLDNRITSWNFGSLRTVSQWAHSNTLDVLNLQFQTAAYGMSPFVHFLPDVVRQVPVVTTFHDLLYPYLFPKAGKLRDWIVMRLARRSTGVVVTNHEDLQRLSDVPHKTLIPIGSNILDPLPPDYDTATWRAKLDLTPSDFVVAHFGFLKRGKGLETLLNSVASLNAESLPAKLLMIGGRTSTNEPTDVAYAKQVDATIASLGITDVVRWTGYVDEGEVAAYLRASDVVALPFSDGASFRRGSLMAAIEHGCAIVTTQPAVNIPAFSDGENMRLFPVGDVTALTGTLRHLYDTPSLRQKLQNGAAELAQHFDWASIARDYTNFFQTILDNQHR